MGRKAVFPDEEALTESLSMWVAERGIESIRRRGKFVVGVSGGSVAKFLCAGLKRHVSDFANWLVFFCDERLVAPDHAESTFSLYDKQLFQDIGNVKVLSSPEEAERAADSTEMKVISVDYSRLAEWEPSILSENYEKTLLRSIGQFSCIDLLVLGIGPDGHTCSLFAGDERNLDAAGQAHFVPIENSPKPPPRRITLNLSAVLACRTSAFVCSGQSKAPVVKRVVDGDLLLPAGRVQPPSADSLHFFLDDAAASLLS